eukprot:Rhum_TRINITY_DN15246_c1_g1::Rhum_TRINITY_DN15246_c1_g1_i2::g.146078::m.146078
MRAYNLPDHFMLGVFLHLPSADVLSLLLTCRGFNAAFQRADRSLDTIRVSYLNNQGGDANRFGRLIDVFGTEELGGQWAVPSADAFEQELVRRAQRTIGTILTALFDFNRRTDSRMRFIVAGGAAVGVLDVRFAGFGDIDVFVAHNGAPPEECHAALRGLLVGVGTKLVETFAEEWTEDAPTMGGYAIVKNASTMSVMAEANDASRTVPPLQFIFRRVTCMEELLCFFDLDCCRFGYDGRAVMTTSEGLRSLELRTNYCGLEHENKELYAKRTLKYFKRALQQTLYRFVHPLGYLFPPKRFLAEARVKRVWPFKCNDDTLVTWVDRNGVSRTNRFSDEAFEGGAEPAFYHALASLPFEAVATIAQVGIETYCHKEVFNVHEAKEAAEGHVFALSFAWLYTLDRSCFYSGGYDKIHLSAKYNIVKCYMTGVYFKVTHGAKSMTCRYTKPPVAQFSSVGKAMNEAPKKITANLAGKVAVVTGGRTKIGFETALLLLRFGAQVVVTTRFPADAEERFRGEADYGSFKHLLQTYALNLKNPEGVTAFVAYMKEQFARIHILVNNAAQTVRRPVRYYKDLLHKEYRALMRGAGDEETRRKRIRLDAWHGHGTDTGTGTDTALERARVVAEFAGPGIPPKLRDLLPSLEDMGRALLATPEHDNPQRQCLKSMFTNLHPDDLDWKESDFPTGVRDYYGEQSDMRERHSWHLRPPEVHAVELFEAQMINHLSPVQLLTGLAALLEPPVAGDTAPGHVINVTSIEGQFSVPMKESVHMHTNMSKASLNMLTRTTAEYYARRGVLVNSVDTGWVSSAIKTWKAPPLTTVDAAFRILNPVLSQSGVYGKLFKNYAVVDW